MGIRIVLKTFLILFLLLLFRIPSDSGAAASEKVERKGEKRLRALPLDPRPWKGDFDEMLKRRVIRVAIPYSRTLYYIDRGQEKGLTAAMARDFELYVNRKYRKQLRNRPVTLYMFPVTRDKLFDRVNDGTADIAAGNLTVTEKRLNEADFIQLPAKMVNEIIVTGAGAPELDSLDKLSGKTVHVRPSSSYHESLLELNTRLLSKGLRQIEIVLLPDAIEDEDVMEMLDVGILQIAVIDDWKARLWSRLLARIKLHDDLVVRKGSRIGWAIRKGDYGLQKELLEFFSAANIGVKGPEHYKSLVRKLNALKNNSEQNELKKFEQILQLFEKYGQQYRFDPLLLAAQGYQESRLDQRARSHVGAIGIMQLMPSTGAAMKVGNIRITEPNIHAGTKYLDHLLSRYFSDASFSDLDRALFAFAAYNAGPGNIAKARKLAEKAGYDPNVWFNNVEIVVAERIGSETTTYVRNVYKYYAAYKLVTDRQKEVKTVRTRVENTGQPAADSVGRTRR